MLSIAIVAALLSGAPHHRAIKHHSLSERSGSTGAVVYPYWSFAADVPTASTLEAALIGGDKSGAWYGLNGDAGHMTGSAKSWASSGSSPVAQAMQVCPNGPNCAPVSRQWLENGIGFQTASASETLTDFSVVWVGQLRGDDGALFARWSNGSSDGLTWLFGVASGTLYFYVGDGTNFTAIPASPNFVARARHCVVGTYDYVADGSSLMKMYLDGTEVATSSSAHGPPLVQATRTTVNLLGSSAGSGARQGFESGVVLPGVILSSARAAAICHAVLADQVITDAGVTWATTRTTASSCPANADENYITGIPAGRVCLGGSGAALASHPAATNLVAASDDFTTTGYSDVGTSVNTGALAGQVAPDGTIGTVDKTQDDGSGFEGRCYTATTSTQDYYTCSVSLKAGSAVHKAHITFTGTGNSAGDGSCDYDDLSETVHKRRGCTSPAAYGAGLSAVKCCVAVGNAAADQGILYLTNWQLETGRVMTPYKRTAGGAYVGAADTGLRLSTPPALISASRGCALYCFTPAFTGSVPAAVRYLVGGDGARFGYLNAGTGVSFYDGTSDTLVANNFAWTRQVKRCERVTWSSTAAYASDYHNRNANVGTGTGAISLLNIGVDTDNSSNVARGAVSDVYFSTHPDGCTQGAKWAAIGDSITTGYDSAPYYVAGWPGYLQGLWGVSPTGKWIQNFAVSGAETSGMQSQFNASVTGKGFYGLIVMGGYNDVKNGTGTAAEIFARKQAIYDAAIGQGMKLVVVTTPPALTLIGATAETRSHDLNTLDIAYCSAHSSVCTSVDFHTLMDDSTDNESVADTVDLIHLSIAGTVKTAGYINAGVTW